MRSKHYLLAVLCFVLAMHNAAIAVEGSRVTFNEEGITLVDGKPFFPVGVFTYELNPTVLAELHELQCNTVLNGFNPDQLDLLHEHGLMAVCHASDDWVKAAQKHPALLAWYLTDEPENRGVTAEQEIERYKALKSKDPNHPIGLCHTAHHALTTFKEACDFTMTDIYPITPKREHNIMGVSLMMDEARRIHGPNWPQWTYIQTFGGPEADNGVWAVPLPHEVRFMVYQALVHRATGILYFSYWPRQPRTWQSVATINDEIHRLVPWLVAPGKEETVKVEDERIQARIRTFPKDGPATAGVLMAINTKPQFVQTKIQCNSELRDAVSLIGPGTPVSTEEGALSLRFAPYGLHVYTWGEEPEVVLARTDHE